MSWIKKTAFYWIVISLSLLSGGASAQTASIALSESSAQFGYGFLVGGSSFGRNEFRVDLLYNDDNVFLLDAGLQVFDEVGSNVKGLTAGLGGKLYGASLGDANLEFLALGVGGMLRYAIPQENRLILGIDAYYAPPIVSFKDAKRFYELAARIQYELFPTAGAYVEYRKYTMEFRKKDINFEEGFRVGMQITF